MDINEFEHLSQLLVQHLRNLRVLETQAATFGSSNIPLHLQNQIYAEKQKISHLRKNLAAVTSQDMPDGQGINFAQQARATRPSLLNNRMRSVTSSSQLPNTDYLLEDSDPIDNGLQPHLDRLWLFLSDIHLGAALLTILVIISIIVGIYEFITYRLSIKFEDDFRYSQGLGTWKSTGVVSIVDDDRAIIKSTNIPTDTAVAPTSIPNYISPGAVQVISSSSAKIYHVIPGVASKGKVYLAESWCKAPQGATCTMFLGPRPDVIDTPPQADYRSVSRQGNGEWQSMVVSYELEQDENLFLFLYAQGKDVPVLFDEVLVRTNN